jgi:outer membrane protein assembly factor BamB
MSAAEAEDPLAVPALNEPASPPHPARRRLLRVAVALSILVMLGGTASALRTHRIATRSSSISPETVTSLALDWTAAAGRGPAAPTVDGDTIYVSTEAGLVAYPTTCVRTRGQCTARWIDFVSDGPLTTPVVESGVVYAGSSTGSVYAFPALCSKSSCAPLWVGAAGQRPLSAPAVNSDFVYVAANTLSAFPAGCGTGDAECPPAWTAALHDPAVVGAPAVGGGLVVVGTQGRDGRVMAFQAACSARCDPVWVGETGGPTTGVVISGGTVYTVARGEVFAFPLSCRGKCVPSWTGSFIAGGPLFEPGATGQPAVGQGRLYVGGADGRLWMFPLSCPETSCDPLGHIAIGGAALSTPVVKDGLVFVISGAGLVAALRDDCRLGSGGCEPKWTDVLSASASSPPSVTSAGIYVADDQGTIYAYHVRPAA